MTVTSVGPGGSAWSPRFLLDYLARELPRYSYATQDERQFHDGLADVLTRLDLRFAREVVAGPRDRFDLVVEDAVVIEAKIKGSFSAAVRQVARYCARDDVHAVLLISTAPWSHPRVPQEGFHGTPVRFVRARGMAL